MKILTQAEFEKLEFKPRKGGITSKVIEEFNRTKEGEALVITKGDWSIKSSPSGIFYSSNKRVKHKSKIRTLADEGGWVVCNVGPKE